jgi:hypothetical protein
MKKFILILLVFYFGYLLFEDNVKFDFIGKYSDVIEAKSDPQGFHGSWFPPFLPESSKNISVRYSHSPSIYRLEFYYSPEDTQEMLSLIKPLNESDVKRILDRLKEHRWKTSIEGQLSVYEPIGQSKDDLDLLYLVLDQNNNFVWYSSWN